MAVDEPIKSIFIITAMEEEAMPIILELNLQKITPSPFKFGLPAVVWKGKVGILTVHLIWCGRDDRFGVNNVATTAASVSTYAALSSIGEPDLILSVGTAGGFAQRGACIGDVFLSTKCVFHARRIPEPSKTKHSNPNFVVLEEYGFGHFRSPNLIGLAHAADLKQGVVTTSDSLDTTQKDMELMMAEGATIKEMEATAVAWVCHNAGIPFAAIKSVTDIVDHIEEHNGNNITSAASTKEMFDCNFDLAVNALKEKVCKVLKLLNNSPLSAFAQIKS